MGKSHKNHYAIKCIYFKLSNLKFGVWQQAQVTKTKSFETFEWKKKIHTEHTHYTDVNARLLYAIEYRNRWGLRKERNKQTNKQTTVYTDIVSWNINGRKWEWMGMIIFRILHERNARRVWRLIHMQCVRYISWSWSHCLSCIYIFFRYALLFSAPFRLFSINENFVFILAALCVSLCTRRVLRVCVFFFAFFCHTFSR